jgi:hypothetical protein
MGVHVAQIVGKPAVSAREYIEKNAPETAKGWRQKNWNGLYAIVIDDNPVRDWWRE